MGKQSKIKSKKGSKSKKTDNKEKEPGSFKITPDISKKFIFKDCFRFWNGDAYVGEFTINEEGDILRQGKGKYLSADRHVFRGQWQDDVLMDAESISYPNGSSYRAPLEDGRYSGVGTYTVPQLGSLECCFLKGRPRGLVTLTVQEGCKWQGNVLDGSSCLTLIPRNHLFDSEDAISKSLSKQ